MTKEIPEIRPAVMSTETGTRLDEYRRFRHVVRNVNTHRFDPAERKPAPQFFAWVVEKEEQNLSVTAESLFGGLPECEKTDDPCPKISVNSSKTLF
jgi:hypothetical protein